MIKKNEAIEKFAKKFSEKYKVSHEIHPDDKIMNFLLNHHQFSTSIEGAVNFYFDDGYMTSLKISRIINSLDLMTKDEYNILEFSSDFGCVTRHFSQELKIDSIECCNSNETANQFITDNFGYDSFLFSKDNPEIKTTKKYDCIVAISFFAHLPKKLWKKWLKIFGSRLNDGGVLIFTTHGKKSSVMMPNVNLMESNYWFTSEDGSHEDDAKWGTCLSLSSFVLEQLTDREILRDSKMQLIYFEESAWWDHQDAYVIQKKTSTD